MGKKWTREEEILALFLYCETPYGKVHATNPDIKSLAAQLGRTADSVSMKMGNFARFDPALRERGIVGLQHGSRLDEEIWNEFSQDWSKLAEETQHIKNSMQLRLEDDVDQTDILSFPEGAVREYIVKKRVNQAFFRKTILAAYENTCCITGLKIPQLLIASHIKPWKDSDPKERTNPSNGLCLNALHDKAFDEGLITVTPDYRILVSKQVRMSYSESIFAEWFERYDGEKIHLPRRFVPGEEFLKYHNKERFVDGC